MGQTGRSFGRSFDLKAGIFGLSGRRTDSSDFVRDFQIVIRPGLVPDLVYGPVPELGPGPVPDLGPSQVPDLQTLMLVKIIFGFGFLKNIGLFRSWSGSSRPQSVLVLGSLLQGITKMDHPELSTKFDRRTLVPKKSYWFSKSIKWPKLWRKRDLEYKK